MRQFFFFLFCFFIGSSVYSQENLETNTDSLYYKALEAYKQENFKTSLEFTQRGLSIAPEYHDIRILQIRNYWALENFLSADTDLNFLLENAPNYVDVKPLVVQRINITENPTEALELIVKVELIYPDDPSIQVKKAQKLLENKQRKEAREIAMNLVTKEGITGGQRYTLQNLLNRTVANEAGINYEYIGFSNDYNRRDSWHTVSPQFQHNFNRTAVIARVNYSTWGDREDILYELEAYPVFNDRFYAFTNIGFSGGDIFPQMRSSLSLFYNFAQFLEAEAGARLMHFSENSYLTGIIGLTAYRGKFYLNGRAFIGPKRLGQYIQNYQANVRYYISTADNYFFLRVGSGISPDERTIFAQVQQNPTLDAYYGNIGINKTLGIHHIFQLGAGMLYEDIGNDTYGTQFLGNISYRYRF